MKKRVLRLAIWAILVLAFGLAIVSCPVGTDENGSGSGGNGGGGGNGGAGENGTGFDTSSVYDFQAFLATLPVAPVPGGGSWPVWSAGNTISVVEADGARALSVSFGGSHGVDLLLTSDTANGVGANLGYMLEIHGRIIVIATGAPATTQLAAIRSALGENPSFNLVETPIVAGSPNFVIRRIITAADVAGGGWPPGPSLRLVNQPSNMGTVMHVTDIRVFRPLPQDPD